ncbi:hypothetical protein Droror1_Dr00004664 [Drosera rotundifolia]
MALRSSGRSLTRTLLATARSAGIRRPTTITTPLPRLRAAESLRPPRRLSFSNPRVLGELGGLYSLMPLHSVVAGVRMTAYVSVEARACCELSQDLSFGMQMRLQE